MLERAIAITAIKRRYAFCGIARHCALFYSGRLHGPSVRPSVCHTRDLRLNGSIIEMPLYRTIQRY